MIRGPGIRAALVVLVAAALPACGDDQPVEVASPDLLGLDADQIAIDVEHNLTRDGIRRAHLVADTAYFLDSGSRVRFRHYTVDFFGSRGQKVSELSAIDGIYEVASGDMEATDSVIVVDDDRTRRLVTERLTYSVADDRLRSDVDFTLYQGNDTIRGTGFVTDPAMDTLTVERPGGVLPPGPDTGGEEAEPRSGEPQPPGEGPGDAHLP